MDRVFSRKYTLKYITLKDEKTEVNTKTIDSIDNEYVFYLFFPL